MQDLKTISRTLNSKQEAEVVLNVTTTYPLKPVLGLIGDMTAAYAATHIRLSRDNMGGSLEKLLTGEAQIVISSLHDVPLDRVEAVPLEAVTILPVCHPAFLPPGKGDVRSDVEMQSHVQVVVSDSSTVNKQNRGLLPGGLRWTVSDFAAKREILLAGMGWGGMPDHTVRDDLENGNLIALRVESYAPVDVAHYAMRLRESDKGIVAQAIWERLVQLHNVSDPSGGLTVSTYDKVIVAGSVHSGKHQPDLQLFVFANRDRFNDLPGMLVSVSLAAAFADTAAEAKSYVDTFLEAAQWRPAQIALVAGAVKPGIYDWFQQSALLEGDLSAHLDEDLQGTKEFTDWAGLGQKVTAFVSA
eukprot:g818.t1